MQSTAINCLFNKKDFPTFLVLNAELRLWSWPLLPHVLECLDIWSTELRICGLGSTSGYV